MTALLFVIDPQNVYFDGGALPVVDQVDSIANIGNLVRVAGAVVMVQHYVKGSPFDGESGMIHPLLRDLPYQFLLTKHTPSLFTAIDEAQDERLIRVIDAAETLIFCGYQTHYCVQAAALHAQRYSNSNKKRIIVSDACSSPNIDNAGSAFSGDDLHRTGLAIAAQFDGTEILSTDVVIDRYYSFS